MELRPEEFTHADKTKDEPTTVIARNRRMQEVFEQAKRYARSQVSILLRGETGVGKDFLARFIHVESGRTGPFVDCTLAHLPESLLESELFGYEKGAFTGATERRTGRLEAAHQGTLFLNEVGKIPRYLQAKLFYFLDHGAVTRLGATQPAKLDLRIIAASSENLESYVRRNKMSREFYYRINVLSLPIPPLRERKEDIPVLADFFLKKHGGAQPVQGLSKATLRMLARYDYPGNVRELEHTILRAMIHAKGAFIEPRDIQFYSLDPPAEALRILNAIKEHRYVTRAAQALGLTRDALNYRIKKYNLRF